MSPRMMQTRRLPADNINRLQVELEFRQGYSSNYLAEMSSDDEESEYNLIEISHRDSSQANMNERRIRRRMAASGDLEDTAEASDSNLKGKRSVESENNSVEPKNKESEPPKGHVFICSICMEPLVEEMSTRCGHIFCKKCITTSLTSKSTCPTCRKNVSMKELIRVFLSSPLEG